MIVRGHRVYRGAQSAGSRLPSVLLFIVVFVILAGLMAFPLLPQYLVYHRDGVEMVVPMLEESGQGYTVEAVSGPEAYGGEVHAAVQVTEPDYSYVDLAQTRGMNYLMAYYIPMSKVTEAGLSPAVKEAQRSISGLGAKGLVLEMKDESGHLAWMSNVAMASSVASNSTWDPSAELAELKADGWYLAAKVSCSVDTLLAQAHPEYALRDSSGAIYTDGNGSWVDLWNRDVRSYIIDLCADLMNMGFDEVILSHAEHPVNPVSYTRNIASSLGREACVMNFSIAVRQGLSRTMTDTGAHLDAVLNHGALTETGTSNGQTLENFLRVYDRVVITTTTYSEDAPVFTAAHYDSTLRFVPQMTWGFGGGSWLLDPSVGTEEGT